MRRFPPTRWIHVRGIVHENEHTGAVDLDLTVTNASTVQRWALQFTAWLLTVQLAWLGDNSYGISYHERSTGGE